MFDYGVSASDQSGYGPRNGDADLGKAGWNGDAMSYFNRTDWLYVHTNGKEGKPQASPLSSMFPWGGQAILKSSVYERTN